MIPRNKVLPLISVITPSYNQGKFLERTILSVVGQKYARLEYIIMDGGSTDNSVEIIKKYEKQIAYWESTSDRGQSHAINKGFKMAKGEYVGWLNSDDELGNSSISELATAIMKNATRGQAKAFYYGKVEVIDEAGKYLAVHPFTERLCFKEFLHKKAPVNQPGSFYSADALRQVGYLNEELQFCMDWDLCLRLLEVGEAEFIPHFMGRFRINSKAKTYNPGIEQLRESYGIFRKHSGCWASKQFLKYMYMFGNYLVTGRVTRSNKHRALEKSLK